MKIKNISAIIALLLLTTTLFGQVENYLYKRPIEGVSEKWHSIPLSREVLDLTNAQNTDIRIVGYDSLGQEIKVPYVIKSQKDQEDVVRHNVNVINESTQGGAYVYVIETADLGQINEFELGIGNINFDGRVKLEGRDGDTWFTILDDYRIFAFSKPSGSYEYTSLELPTSDYNSYRISLSNIVDPKLNWVSVLQRTVTEGKYYNTNVTIRHIEDNAQRKTSKYLIELESKARISELSFDIEGDFDYYRSIKLSAIGDSIKSKKGWKTLKKSLFSGSLISYENEEISFNETVVSTFEMIVYNLDDQPLKINSVTARTPEYSLVARFLSNSNFYLFYGHPKAAQPRYDLTNFEEKIPDRLKPLQLGKLMQNRRIGTIVNFFIPSYVLWAIMAIIIAVIGWFTIQMLSSERVAEK